jgi:hypothetical protein
MRARAREAKAMSYRMNNLPGAIPAGAAGVGLVVSLIDIAAIAAVQAVNSSVATALAEIGGSLC